MGGGPLRVGELELIALSDGEAILPPGFWVGFDFAAHPGLLGDDGNIHMPIGCYVVRHRGRTVLLDTGLGPVRTSWGNGGRLVGELGRVGIGRDEIDTVVLTHLHVDHAGGVADTEYETPMFPNATVRYGDGDWEQFVVSADAQDGTRRAMELLAGTGRLEPISGDMVSLAPGMQRVT